MSAEDARAVLLTAGALAAAMVAVATAARLPAISKPIRWLWRRVVSEPVTAWVHRSLDEWATNSSFGSRLDEIEAQLHPNGGSSLRDRVDVTARAVGAPDPPQQRGHAPPAAE